ncbi:MAG: TIGR00366 family protein [Fervidicoccaceae archaeon]|jgi:hypothetical protein|nr:TIGR00366 family protein [Fervidicoccaceae archaeon]
MSSSERKSVLERYSEKVADFIRPLMPDPLIFALLLTFATFSIVLAIFPPWKTNVSATNYNWKPRTSGRGGQAFSLEKGDF